MLSVVIITKNEEEILPQCLDAASFADEVIVVDSGSTDNTVSTAEKYGAKVIRKKWAGYTGQKNFAISRARGEWVLSLDADEIITPKLREEILLITRRPGARADGYNIPRKNIIYGRFMRFGGLYPDRHTRLFKRGKGKFRKAEVHEGMDINGKTGELKHHLLHYTKDTLRKHVEYVNNYTGLEAKAKVRSGCRPAGYAVLLRPFFHFMKSYVKRLGFLDGAEGLVYHYVSAWYVFMKEIKTAEKTGFDKAGLAATLFKKERRN